MNLTKRNQSKPGKLNSEDEMIQMLEIKGGKVQNELPLMEGSYICVIISNKEKTVKEYQMEYFAIIDEMCMSTGNDRYTIHEMFKDYQKISSTRDIPIEQWQLVIWKLKEYCLINS